MFNNPVLIVSGFFFYVFEECLYLIEKRIFLVSP